MARSILGRLSVLAVLLAGVCASIGPHTDLTIANKVISPDGFSRDSVLADGTFPGPIISGNKGDSFQIKVFNNLTDPALLTQTTIHWHGMFQHGTTWADGPAFVSQCPIVSGDSFEYSFDPQGQTGTYWYHSHISTQYCDGLRGPLIIYDPDDPHKHLYDVDDDSTVITLADWYHYILPVAAPLPPQNANSTLINGLGRYVNDTTSELAVITVEHGKRYRFRLISTSCDPAYNFAIDNHTMLIIEADGQNTEALAVDSLQIFAAQRYSFVLEANQTIGNYWIRANPNGTEIAGFTGGINSAILRYVGAPNEEPATVDPPVSVNPLFEFNLHPLEDPAAPGGPGVGEVGHPLNLNLGFNGTTGLFTIDNVSFVSPRVPVLLQILSGTKNPQELMPAGSIFSLPRNTVVELSLPGMQIGGKHPFHLHGHTFSVVRSAGIGTYNFKNPVRRDTVSIGEMGDNVTIRFETNNPGPWFLHCHIDFHLTDGFAIVFAEDTPDIAAANPVPADWKQLCPLYDAAFPDSS